MYLDKDYQQIQIFVDGDQIKPDFVVDGTNSVAEIKTRIESMLNIPVAQQCLIMMVGKELHNVQTVNNINAHRSHSLRVSLKHTKSRG